MMEDEILDLLYDLIKNKLEFEKQLYRVPKRIVKIKINYPFYISQDEYELLEEFIKNKEKKNG